MVLAMNGGNWLLGIALAWHKGRLYASFGFNQGAANNATEAARGGTSSDGGKPPDAVYHGGTLYVGYAVKNHRTAEMAVMPIPGLRVEP